jgi:hypothetical protein
MFSSNLLRNWFGWFCYMFTFTRIANELLYDEPRKWDWINYLLLTVATFFMAWLTKRHVDRESERTFTPGNR